MIERPRTHQKEAAEETGNRYLANLGLEWDDLQGKRILDIGALSAEFENAARRRGVEVISMDNELADEDLPPADSQFVVANATKMPFKEGSFDYAVSHMSVTNYLEKGYREEDHLLYIEDALREACRVLKPNGEFRFLMPPDWESDAQKERRTENEHRILEEVAKRAGFRELKLEDHLGSLRARPEGDERLTHYYIALK
jgi:ubiquinone/menaquinone biosynthesis C-methylase UbiE